MFFFFPAISVPLVFCLQCFVCYRCCRRGIRRIVVFTTVGLCESCDAGRVDIYVCILTTRLLLVLKCCSLRVNLPFGTAATAARFQRDEEFSVFGEVSKGVLVVWSQGCSRVGSNSRVGSDGAAKCDPTRSDPRDFDSLLTRPVRFRIPPDPTRPDSTRPVRLEYLLARPDPIPPVRLEYLLTRGPVDSPGSVGHIHWGTWVPNLVVLVILGEVSSYHPRLCRKCPILLINHQPSSLFQLTMVPRNRWPLHCSPQSGTSTHTA